MDQNVKDTHEGKQLTLRYVRSKTEKALYGCNTNSDETTHVKEVFKTQYVHPTKGLAELTIPCTLGFDTDETSEDTQPKRPHTMPAGFNIRPWEQIDDLKLPHISPTQSSESELHNMAALNTPLSPSPFTSFSMAGHSGTFHQGALPTVTSVEYEFSVNESTDVKYPVGIKRPKSRQSEPVNTKRNIEYVHNMNGGMEETKPIVSGTSKQVVNDPAVSFFRQDLASQGQGYAVNNQSSEPIECEYEQNDLNVSTTTGKEVLSNQAVGLRDLSNSMEFETDNDLDLSEVHMDSDRGFASRYNDVPNNQLKSNVYVAFPLKISPVSNESENSNECADIWDVNLAPEMKFESGMTDNDKGQPFGEPAEESAEMYKYKSKPFSSGRDLALQEQCRKLQQFSSHACMEKGSQDTISQESTDFTNFSPSSKQSPFVHTPPPQPGSPQAFMPVEFLDVTSMHGIGFHPMANPQIFHPANFHHHGALLPSDNTIIPNAMHPQHGHFTNVHKAIPPTSLPVQHSGPHCANPIREPDVQSSGANRQIPGKNTLTRAVSSISEPPLQYPATGCENYQNRYENGPYLTPVNDGRNARRSNPKSSPSQGRRDRSDSGASSNGDYNYIDPRLIPQVPSRPPPVPARQQYRPPRMSLDDQTARIPGWCPHETDATIERTMQNFRGQNGYFIVWKSYLKNRYIISVSHNNELLHFLIEEQRIDSSTDRVIYYLYNGGFRSESLLELVNHYIYCGVRRRLNDSPIGTKAYTCEHIPLRRALKVKVIQKPNISSGSK